MSKSTESSDLYVNIITAAKKGRDDIVRYLWENKPEKRDEFKKGMFGNPELFDYFNDLKLDGLEELGFDSWISFKGPKINLKKDITVVGSGNPTVVIGNGSSGDSYVHKDMYNDAGD